MRLLFPILLATACTDYEVHSLNSTARANWFDDASERYRAELDDLDTGWVEDTGFMGVGEAIVPEGSPDDPAPEGENDRPTEDDPGSESPSDDADTPPEDDGSDVGAGGDGGSTHDPAPDVPLPPGSARGPGPGEVIFTELMIYPRATDDSTGEWVEVRNVGSVWVDLVGYQLGDRGVDGTEVIPVSTGSLMVAPGEYLTLCASADFWDNGGVACDGTYHYRTLGDGFALSNTEDEARLLNADGGLIDEVRYGEGFASEGEALGLRNDVISPIANDDEDVWCEQRAVLSFGDAGTPGVPNDNCW